MKRCRYNFHAGDILRHTAVILICSAFFTIFSFAAESVPKTDRIPEEKKIHIIANRLVSDSKARFAEFIGNVKATQGTTTITADRLKVYYKGNLEKETNIAPGEDTIKKMVSNGNVTIKFDNRIATSDQAVYMTETRILILTGPDSTIKSGNNSVTGDKITLYRNDGRIYVESSGEKRVKAVFNSGNKGIQ
ncbi:MAG: lipopolysaccharide transport periplasmic protein LptA [Desulfobacterales bacterium]